MRYFNYLSDEELSELFYLPPQQIAVDDTELLKYALGATLYMPATRPTIVSEIIAGKLKGLMSMVLCLEDAIGDNEVKMAEVALHGHLNQLAAAINSNLIVKSEIPLMFIRVRSAQQMRDLVPLLAGNLSLLTGFVFPKFTAERAPEYLEILVEINGFTDKKLYGMPILESSEIINIETRPQQLLAVKNILDQYREYILNVRIGATDLSGLFGLRRSPDHTIYDIAVIRDCIADFVNVFRRSEQSYVISGPVWEFYSSERVLKPQLRESPFMEELGQRGERLRDKLVCRYLDGLIHEIILDKANGLTGKTIIHPSHIKPVQALCVVTHEEYTDAKSILAGSGGDVGVMASSYGNKMNEIKPHWRWAQKIMQKSKIYGVFNEQHNYTSLLG